MTHNILKDSMPADLLFASDEVKDAFSNILSPDTEITVSFENTCGNLIFPGTHTKNERVLEAGPQVELTLLVRDIPELDNLVEKDIQSLIQAERLAEQTRKLIAQERPRDKDYAAAAFYVTSPERKFTELTGNSPKPLRGSLKVLKVGEVKETAQNMVSQQHQMNMLLTTMAKLLAAQVPSTTKIK